MTIPRILHVCWIGPHRPPTEMIQTWADKHPGERSWFFTTWTAHEQGWENQAQINARGARNEWNGAADLMRWEILYKYGGFIVDADSECLMALDEGPLDFLSNDTVVACYENESVRPGIIGCGFLGAPKGHPFIRACIDDCKTQTVDTPAWKAVGPLCIGRVASKMPEGITIYPAATFNPVHYSGTKAPDVGKDGKKIPTYARQGWGSTKGYGSLRKLACTCPTCSQTMLRPSWG